MKTAPFKSDFAILDVKQGRAALERRVQKHGPIRVRVEMTINYTWGNDDGISTEFSCTTISVKEYV
jgi:hypothetical protein